MDELILKYLGGEATDVEVRRLKDWRAASPENERRVRELEAIWAGLGRIPTATHGPRPRVEDLVGEAEARRARSRSKQSRRAFVRSGWAGYGLAAAAILVLVLVGTSIWGDGPTRAPALAPVRSAVGVGQVVTMTLSDGSYVHLAEGARLDFPAEAGRREVVVDGRAFFAVARAPDPFTVRTPIAELTVRGTRFEVRTGGDLLRLVVVDGIVDVAGPGGRARVVGGQVATVRTGGAPEVATVEDVWPLLDWPGGVLAFQRTPLRDVARELARYYGVEVAVPDSAVAALRVTGSFHGDSLTEVVDAVCAVTGIQCDRTGSRIVLGAPGGQAPDGRPPP